MQPTDHRAFCFGKLPIAGDFVRGDAGAPELAELDGWIQEGMHHSQHVLGSSWQERFDALPPARFLWTAERRGVVVAGWWRASRDASGRRYPFLLGVRLRGVSPADHVLLPVALAEFFERSRSLIDSSWTGLNAAGAIAVVRKLEYLHDPKAAVSAFWSELDETDPESAWAGIDRTGGEPELLFQDLEQLATGAAPPRFSVRWPLRGESIDMSFWLAVLEQFGSETPRLVIWHAAADLDPGIARLATGRLEPRLFAGMVFPDLDDDGAYDLGRAHGDDRRLRSALDRFGHVVEQDTARDVLTVLQEGPR